MKFPRQWSSSSTSSVKTAGAAAAVAAAVANVVGRTAVRSSSSKTIVTVIAHNKLLLLLALYVAAFQSLWQSLPSSTTTHHGLETISQCLDAPHNPGNIICTTASFGTHRAQAADNVAVITTSSTTPLEDRHNQNSNHRNDTIKMATTVQLALRTKEMYDAMKTHRGGWPAVLNGLHANGVLAIDKPSPPQKDGALTTDTVDFVDFVDEWFGWGQRGAIGDPWVGIVHMSVTKELPKHLHREALDVYLESESFRNSSRTCMALVALSTSLAVQVRETLVDMGITNIKVCVANHPVTVEAGASRFDPTVDLPAALSNTSAVVLLGVTYRRIATIHKLQTSRRKVWLPGKTRQAKKRQNIELKAEHVSLDKTVEMKRLGSNDDYDRFLRQNIIVLDMWAAVANNAVLECMALQVPCLIRKLNGPVEYLGEDYPLFFSSFDELQQLIDNEDELRTKMWDAHHYLKALDTRNSKVEHLGQQLMNCTLESMATWEHP
jgi:hypothetical protein